MPTPSKQTKTPRPQPHVHVGHGTQVVRSATPAENRADQEDAQSPRASTPAAAPGSGPRDALARISAARASVLAEREALSARLEELTAQRAFLRLRAIHADHQAESLQKALDGSPDQLVAARAALLVAAGTPDAAQAAAKIDELQTKVAQWRQQFDDLEADLAADTERLQSLEELSAALEDQRATAQRHLGEELAEVYAREIAEAKAQREAATRDAQDAADTERALWRRMQGELEAWPDLLTAELRRSKHLAHEPNATPLQRVAAAALAYFEALNAEAKELPVVIGFDGTNVADILELTAQEAQLLIQRPHGPRSLPDAKLNALRSWASGEVRADTRPFRPNW